MLSICRKNQALRLLNLFVKDKNGQIAVIFSLLLVPLAAFIGGAVDLTQKVSYERKLQATLDTVSLAAAKAIARDSSITDKALKLVGDAIYNANYKQSYNITSTPYNIARSATSLKVTQTASLKTTFMALVGQSELNINVASIVNITRSDIELALILDTTLSMVLDEYNRRDPSKLNSLKSASKTLVKTLIGATTGASSVRIGLVPWSTGVNVYSTRKKTINGNSKGKHYCAGSRGQPRDVSPYSKKLPYAKGNTQRGLGQVESCPNREIMPLSSNKAALLSEIDKWEGNHWTSSDTGLTWGWGVLSPNWSDYWKASSKPKPYNGEAKKYAILMTDGYNNLKHVQSNKRSLDICEAMKAKNIRIYTIGFKLGEIKKRSDKTNAEELMRDCASSPDMNINADDGASLNLAFKKIADEVGSFYISG